MTAPRAAEVQALATAAPVAPGALPGYNVPGKVVVEGGATLAVSVGGAGDWNSGVTDDIGALLANATFNAGSFFGIDASDGNFTYAGDIGGGASSALGLVKLGENTLTLTGGNTYSGGTTISGGTLQLGDGVANNGSVAGDILDNSALAFANPDAQTYSGAISGDGALYADGPGTLTLSGSNTYSGGTTINGGTLDAASSGALAGYDSSSEVAVENGATLAMGSGSALQDSTLDISDGGAINFGSQTAVTLGGLEGNGDLSLPSGLTLSVGADNADTTYAGSFSGTGNLVKIGSGTLTLAAPGAPFRRPDGFRRPSGCRRPDA